MKFCRILHVKDVVARLSTPAVSYPLGTLICFVIFFFFLKKESVFLGHQVIQYDQLK